MSGRLNSDDETLEMDDREAACLVRVDARFVRAIQAAESAVTGD